MKAYITNVQSPAQQCGFGVGATWAEAVADALRVEPRAYVGADGRVYVDFSVSLGV